MLSYAETVSQVTHLFCADPFYRRRSMFILANAVLPAIKYGKYLVDEAEGRIRGFVSYALLTYDEAAQNLWDGDEVSRRDSADVVCLTQFVFDGPRRDMVAFVRRVQRELSKLFPTLKAAHADRVRPDGSKRPAIMYRKDEQ